MKLEREKPTGPDPKELSGPILRVLKNLPAVGSNAC